MCLYSLLGSEFPISGGKDVYLSHGTGRVHFKWKIYFVLSGDRGGRWNWDVLALAVS